MKDAVRALRARGLIALPTETVYGLGADAENRDAVAKIFAVKGRPTGHPLIVHVADAPGAMRYAAHMPKVGERLAAAFWPGPLTLIVKRSAHALDAVTGGLGTVALRVPRHPVASEVLRTFGRGVAAPSANRFTRVSPTTAEHVRADLGDAVDVILDGGPSEVGLESTIVDVSTGSARLLRPGGITREQLEAVLGATVAQGPVEGVRAPGEHALHYAPRARVVLVSEAELPEQVARERASGARVAVLARSDAAGQVEGAQVSWFTLPGDDRDLARELYATLRRADETGADVIVTTTPVDAGVGAAILDRLRRAAGPRGR